MSGRRDEDGEHADERRDDADDADGLLAPREQEQRAEGEERDAGDDLRARRPEALHHAVRARRPRRRWPPCCPCWRTATTPASLVCMLRVAGWSLPYSQLVNCGTMMMASATIMMQDREYLHECPLCRDAGPATPPGPSARGLYGSVLSPSIESKRRRGRHGLSGRTTWTIQRPARLAAALAALFATAVAGRRPGRLQRRRRRRRAAGRRRAARRLRRRRRRHQRGHDLHTRDLVALMADAPTQAERFNAASLAAQKIAGQPAPPAAAPGPRRHARLLRRRRQLGQQPAAPQVRRRAARRRRRRRPTTSASTSRSPCPTRSPTPAPTTTRSPCASTRSSCTATCPRRGCAATCSSTWARTRAAATRCGPAPIHYLGPLIRARRGRPVRIKFVNQLPPGQGGRPVPARGHDRPGAPARARWAATTCTRRTARRCTCTAGSRPGSAAARSTSGSRRPASAAPTGRARAWSTSPTCGSTRRADRCAKARPAPPTTRARARPRCTSPTTRAPASSTCTTTPSASRASACTRARRRPTSSATPSRTSSSRQPGEPPRAGPSTRRRAGTVPAAELPLVIEDKTFVPDAGAAPRPGPDLGRRPLGRPRRPLVSARVHAQPERRGRSTDVNAKGRWDYLPWYWTGLRGHGERPRGQPALRHRRLPSPSRTRARPAPRRCPTRSSTPCSSTAPPTPT